MSIKIYEARRVPIARFAEATDILHDLISDAFYKKWSERLDLMLSISKPEKIDDEWIMNAENKIQRLRENRPFDFDSSHSYGFSFWLDTEYAYIIPYGEGGLNYPEWIEDYHYQNQVDMDPDISDQEWDSRLQKWNELWLENTRDRRYMHAVVDPSDGFYMAFSSYTLKWFNEKLADGIAK